jgi:DNA-binding response OmpR family regulator
MKWRILIVDDEPDVRLIIKTTLMGKYEVLEAHDGLDALEKVDRYEPDFVLMDVMMPLMNGFEACAAIRKNPRYKDLPVMFLTALGAREDHMKGFASGANRYMTKPFDPSRLLKNIDNLFEEMPPTPRKRRYTIEDIRRAEDGGAEPIAPGAGFAATDTKPTAPAAPPAAPKPTYNVGTTETIRDMEPPSLPPDSKAGAASGLPRVMVVDDKPEVIELVRMSLEGLVEVVSAADGMEAIEKLVKYQPEILILDIMLPRMNGFQLCQSLRANRAFSRIPILVCSARSSERDVAMAKRLGANDFLAKPFSPAELIARVTDLQNIPGFRVRPKTFTIEQINAMEGRAADKADVFDADDEARAAARPGAKSNKELEGFLHKVANKDALERPTEDKEKPKRRFFGLGGRD